MALAFEPGEGDSLKRRPRSPREPIFNRLMVERTLLGAAVIGGVGFATFQWMLAAGQSVDSARNSLLLLMVLFENVHIANCRSESQSAFQVPIWHSPGLLLSAVCAFTLHVTMMYSPLGKLLLSTRPVDMQTWIVLVGLSLTVLVAIEIHKLIRFQRIAKKRKRPAVRSQDAL